MSRIFIHRKDIEREEPIYEFPAVDYGYDVPVLYATNFGRSCDVVFEVLMAGVRV